MMVTEQSVLFELDVGLSRWRGVSRRVACFRAHWDGKDCFFLAPTGLTFPMTVKKLYEFSHLVLTVGSRDVVKDRYFDEDSRGLREAVASHLDVEYVHGL
jgi:hypothetical protein